MQVKLPKSCLENKKYKNAQLYKETEHIIINNKVQRYWCEQQNLVADLKTDWRIYNNW